MKRWKKAALVLLVLLLISQAPFIYRRYKLGRLHATIETLKRERIDDASGDGFDDYKGVIHVHSALGGHSTGQFSEIVEGARANDLAFVVMTEHPSRYVNTAEATLKGIHDGVLFIPGSEINTTNDTRLFIIPGIPAPPAAPDAAMAQNLINQARQQGRLALIAYPEQVRDWQLSGYDGVEVYNLYTNTKNINYGLLFFDALWSYPSYPALLFATFYQRPTENLRRWDELNAQGDARRAAIAGNDAHANVGLSFQQQTGRSIFEVKFDPYERSFRLVRNHVLLAKGQALTPETLLQALREGHSYISFDLFSDAGGFRFFAENGSARRIMGDEIALAPGESIRLTVSAPVKSRMLFLRDGQLLHEEKETLRKELTVDRTGVYRVEVYLDQLGNPLSEQPWIISNPIYVR